MRGVLIMKELGHHLRTGTLPCGDWGDTKDLAFFSFKAQLTDIKIHYFSAYTSADFAK